MTSDALEGRYIERYDRCLKPISVALQAHLVDIFKGCPRIDRICVRPKEPSSFLRKAMKLVDGVSKYNDPMAEIQDQIAARIVGFYLGDVDRAQGIVKEYFGPIEERRVEPESWSEFGYEGYHYILFLPDEALPREINRQSAPTFFELQIKTLFQHAWSEAGHDLIYKSAIPLTRDHLRRAAFTAAQAWGADLIFRELSEELLPST